MIEYVRDSDGSLPRTAASWLYKKVTEAGIIDRSDRGARKALTFCRKNLPANEQPFFMFLNLMEGHMPFLTPDEYLTQFDPEVDRNI